jgi:hypothetical protein
VALDEHMPSLQPGDQVQWAQSNASVRSSRYHGIGKVHVVSSQPWRTVCGRRIAPPSMRWTNQFCDARCDYAGLTDDIYCKHCVKNNG